MRFQKIYNEERTHEALAMKTPSDVYRRLPCEMSRLSEHEYAIDVAVRRVRRDDSVKWVSGYLSLGEAMAGELVGLGVSDGEP